MKIELYSNLRDEDIEQIFDRKGDLLAVKDSVNAIIEDVKDRGDVAVCEFTEKFDRAKISESKIRVSESEVTEAFEAVDDDLIVQLELAAENIRRFHESQTEPDMHLTESEPGVFLGQKIMPIASIGAYIPGGRAAYPSTALMTVIPAKVAGVGRVVVCTPPQPDGSVNPLTLVAASIAGADEIYRIGGVQAIASMAYGTESIGSVLKIVGPGNVFVTCAKMMVDCEIDFPAGPSEILIIADETANAAFVAADMLAQAEHDPSAVSILVTTSKKLAFDVAKDIEAGARTATRAEIISQSLENACILVMDSMDECIAFSNRFGPEHLEIVVVDPLLVLNRITSAGSIFVGNYAPVSAGDYASGTNHVLPTAGYTAQFSGLNVQHFQKRSTIQMIDKGGLEGLSETIITLAEAEGLDAHAEAVRIRVR